MRKSRRNYHREITREPFELDLDNPVEGGPACVTFRDPNKLETESAFGLARTVDPEDQLRILLSEADFAAFWAEWRTAPVDETNALLEDVLKHYGVDRGKLAR